MQMQTTQILQTLLVFVVVFFVREAIAQNAPNTAVVIIDSGTSDLLVESMVRGNAEAALSEGGFAIVKGASVAGSLPQELLACVGDVACSARVIAAVPAEHVFFLSLRSEGEGAAKNFKIVVRDYLVATGEISGRLMKRCATCKEDVDLTAFAAEVVEGLLNLAKPALPDTVSLSSYRGSASGDNVSAGDSGTTNLPVALGIVSIGVGSLALIAGTTLLLIDGPVIEDGLRMRNQNDTAVPGLVSLGVGIAAVALGTWLWASNYEGEDQESRPIIVPSTTGASVVWSGGF